MSQTKIDKNKGKRTERTIEMPHRGYLGNFLFKLGMLLTRMFTRFRVTGQENLPEPPYVIASNHETLIDGMWICAGLPKKHQKVFAAIAGSDLKTDYGLFGQIMMRVGRAIPINRFGNPIRGLIMAKKAADQGYILLIHPEGTRTYDGLLGELQNGATYISTKSSIPMVPVYVHGGYEVFSRHMSVPHPIDWKKFRRKRVTIEYGQPFDPHDFADVNELTEVLRNWYLQRQDAKEQA